jgi:DNA-directed RNA polymerase subunit beta
MTAGKTVYAVRDGRIDEVDSGEVDYKFISPNQFFSTNVNASPQHSATPDPRLFYAARFFGQAQPLQNPEVALVQNLSDDDPEGRSFDEILGRDMGALRAREDATVAGVDPDGIDLVLADGTKRREGLYNNFAYNRKSGIHHTALVKPGDAVKAGAMLAKSNYTDDKGTMALGSNAYIALVPWKGYSMDDALVVSSDFAKRLTSEHMTTEVLEKRDGTRTGLNHYKAVFPRQFDKDRLANMDDDGVAKPGSILKAGDPYVLATAPRAFSSRHAETLGKLSRSQSQVRKDNSMVWDGPGEAQVVDVAKTSKGIKVVLKAYKPATYGDKVVMRSGQKGTISEVIPMDRMPRDSKGVPFDVLLNPLSVPSRVNDGLPYELLFGKVAKKQGQPIKLPSFTKPGEKWYDKVEALLKEHGLESEDTVFDPEEDRFLDNPVLTGYGQMLKLHHLSESKYASRGQASYDTGWDQPAKGGETGAKRHSGLEVNAIQASGAYALNRENSTLRGQKNDDFWRAVRSGRQPVPPGKPFAWHKFRVLLQGAGLDTAEKGKGQYRLGPMTDARLAALRPVDLRNSDLVDTDTFEPKPGGLFDPVISGGNRWARIRLDNRIPNPAQEDSIRRLLGLTKKQFDAVMAGEMELPEQK